MAIEGIQDLWHVINGDLDTESANLIKEATANKADNVVDLTELAVSVRSAKAVSRTTSKAFSEASSKLKDALSKAKKVGNAVSDEARAMARSARQVVRKQFVRFRDPGRTATQVDLDGLMREYGIPSTLNEKQRAACDAVGLEMRLNPERIFATKLDVDKYIDGLLEQKGVLLNRGKTLDNHHYYEIMMKVEYKGLKFKPGDYISRDTLHHEIEWFRGKNTHKGAINSIDGNVNTNKIDPGRTLKIK